MYTYKYKHHAESIEIMKDYFRKEEGVIALIHGGSVAKGNERPDSDLDGMVIVDEETYAKRVAAGTTAGNVSGLCTYPEGYFDVKYMTKAYLLEAAEKGSEPTRNSFLKARVLFSDDPEIEDIVKRIGVFQVSEKEDKMLSFYGNYSLNFNYLLKTCKAEGYMRVRTIAETVYSIYRIILQEHEILYPCNRRLEAFVEEINDETRELVRLGRKFCETQDIAVGDEFVDYFHKITTYQPPEDRSKVYSRYVTDFEQWWRIPRPNVNEW